MHRFFLGFFFLVKPYVEYFLIILSMHSKLGLQCTIEACAQEWQLPNVSVLKVPLYVLGW